MTELKNCPFCGGSAELGCDEFGDPAVGCSDRRCHGTTHYGNGCDSDQEAIDKWNRRADEWVSASDATPETEDPVMALSMVRYKLYKPNSQQANSGMVGRWQEFNGFGWINRDEPVKWKPESK